jgi:uncharacterized membrane protein
MSRLLLLAALLNVMAACAERREPTFTFTELSFPGSTRTVAAGIDDAGHIVGWYENDGRTAGFVYRDGAYTTVEYPGAMMTQVYGIAMNGDIVGSYRREGETAQFGGRAIAFHGFLRTAAGEFLDVRHPDHKYSIAQRLLRDGTVIGCYHDDDFTTMRGITIPREAITASGVPAAAVRVMDAPASMNNGGTPDGTRIAGLLMDRGLAYIAEEGVLSTFSAPGAAKTEAWDMNPSGIVVGVFVDGASVSHGYVLEDGRFTPLDYPGATNTVAFGINARGDVVGGWDGLDGQRRGFVATRR